MLRLAPAAGEVCVARLFDLMLVSYLSQGLGARAFARGDRARAHRRRSCARRRRPGSTRGSSRPSGTSASEPGSRSAWRSSSVSLPCCARSSAPGRFSSSIRGSRRRSCRCSSGWRRPASASTSTSCAGCRRSSATEIAGLEAEIYRLAGERFNIQSPQQLGTILFEKLKLPAGKKTKKTKSYSTGAETLEELAAAGHELPQYLLRYRELAKLKSTYVDALPQIVGGGRARSTPASSRRSRRPAGCRRSIRICRTSPSARSSG